MTRAITPLQITNITIQPITGYPIHDNLDRFQEKLAGQDSLLIEAGRAHSQMLQFVAKVYITKMGKERPFSRMELASFVA